jgi:hypothetical protein
MSVWVSLPKSHHTVGVSARRMLAPKINCCRRRRYSTMGRLDQLLADLEATGISGLVFPPTVARAGAGAALGEMIEG